DPFPSATRSTPPPALRGRLDLSEFGGKSPATALAQVGAPVRELELVKVDGRACYIATLAGGDTRVVPVVPEAGLPVAAFDADRLVAIVKESAQPAAIAETRVLDEYDRYYLDRHHGRPLPVILARLDDPDQTRFYIDPKTARVVGTYSSRRWVSRY